MKIGCICCDYQSEIIASYDTYKEANDIAMYLSLADLTTVHKYEVFEIKKELQKLNSVYDSYIEYGKKMYQERHERVQKRALYKNIREAYLLAIQMRGRVEHDTRIDDTYIKKYVPEEILTKMCSEFSWIDEDNFEWGFKNVRVDCDEKGTFITLANRYDGQGYHTSKVFRIDTNKIEEKHFG